MNQQPVLGKGTHSISLKNVQVSKLENELWWISLKLVWYTNKFRILFNYGVHSQALESELQMSAIPNWWFLNISILVKLLKKLLMVILTLLSYTKTSSEVQTHYTSRLEHNLTFVLAGKTCVKHAGRCFWHKSKRISVFFQSYITDLWKKQTYLQCFYNLKTPLLTCRAVFKKRFQL